MICNEFRKIGAAHKEQNKSSGDISLHKETETLRLFGLADAQSGAEYGEVGAHAVLDIVANHFAENSDQISALLSSDEKHADMIRLQIRAKLVFEIISRLETLAGTPKIDPFASTLMFCAIDKMTGAAVFINLGDGMICARKNNGEAETILGPDRNPLWDTYLTNTTYLSTHIRIDSRSANDYTAFALLTDGTDAYGTDLRDEAKLHIRKNAWKNLLPQTPFDDATVFVCENYKNF